jgi:hypothetical protein
MRAAVRKACVTLPTEPRFLGARTATPIYSNSSETGYKMK